MGGRGAQHLGPLPSSPFLAGCPVGASALLQYTRVVATLSFDAVGLAFEAHGSARNAAVLCNVIRTIVRNQAICRVGGNFSFAVWGARPCVRGGFTLVICENSAT